MERSACSRMSTSNYSIRTIWGLAKSPELALPEPDLYALIYRETRKEHMRELSQGDINKVCRVLSNMKDGAKRDMVHKRTDTGGDSRTERLRHKIYALTGELGWNDDNSRINGFVKRMCGIDRIEWLSPMQCNKVIEALKKMIERQNDAQQLGL